MRLFSKRREGVYSRLSNSNGNSPGRKNNVQNSKANIGAKMRNSLKSYLRNHANITYNAKTPLDDYIGPAWMYLFNLMRVKKTDLYRPANRQSLMQSILDVMTNEELASMPKFWMGPGANRLAA